MSALKNIATPRSEPDKPREAPTYMRPTPGCPSNRYPPVLLASQIARFFPMMWIVEGPLSQRTMLVAALRKICAKTRPSGSTSLEKHKHEKKKGNKKRSRHSIINVGCTSVKHGSCSCQSNSQACQSRMAKSCMAVKHASYR